MKKRKLVLALMLSLMMLVSMIPAVSFADGEDGTGSGVATSGNCGAAGSESDVTWSFDEATGTLTISGQGAMADYSSNSERGWNGYANQISKVVVSDGITYVGNRAFQGLACTVVSLPATMNELADMAFGSMQQLEQIILAKDNQAYAVQDDVLFSRDMKTLIKYPAKKNVTSYKVPDGVTTLSKHAFSHTGEGGLTKVSLPDSLKTIDSYAFQGNAGGSNFVIPNSVTTLGTGVFSNNTTIQSVTIGNSLKEISYSCFSGSNCETIIFAKESQLETIGGYAFDKCTKLTSIDLPSTVQEIGEMAFRDCSSLNTVQFDKGLKTIGRQAFMRCTSLKNVEIDGAIESIAANAFVNCPIEKLSISANADLTIQDKSFFLSTILPSVQTTVVGSKTGKVVLSGALLSGQDTSSLKLFGDLVLASSSGLMYINDSVEKSNWHTLDMTEVTGVEFTTESDANGRVWPLGGNASYRNKGIIYVSENSLKNELIQKNFNGKRTVIYAVTNGGIFKADKLFEAATLAEPERTGFVFNGWYDNENFTGDKVTVPETGKTYYADWTAKEEQNMLYKPESVTKHLGDEAFTNELTKTDVHGDIIYKSSDEKVATVDAATGEVTIVGAGTATITATAAETEDYKEASASYELTVTNHEFKDSWESDADNHWHSCAVEGCTVKSDEAAHDFEWIVDKNATATEKGTKHEECTVCHFQKDPVEIPAKGTSDGDQNANGSGTNADTSADGTKTGDAMPIGLLAVLMMAAAAGIAFCGRKLYKSR